MGRRLLANYEKFNRSEIDDAELQKEEPLWGELGALISPTAFHRPGIVLGNPLEKESAALPMGRAAEMLKS